LRCNHDEEKTAIRKERQDKVATAKLVLPDGTTVSINGSADEVATLLTKLSKDQSPLTAVRKQSHKPATHRKSTKPDKSRPKRKGPKVLIKDLADENFFKSKRTIGDVQKKLEEKGHIYGMNTLSTPLLRLTRERVLRRIKDKDGWVYVC